MADNNEELFYKLITAAGKLATVSDQASVVLDERFESLVRPSVDEVRAVLRECPVPPEAWDGELREEDLDVTTYTTGLEPVNERAIGVKIVHTPTGIGRQSESKQSQLQNREVALKALRKAVEDEIRKRKS